MKVIDIKEITTNIEAKLISMGFVEDESAGLERDEDTISELKRYGERDACAVYRSDKCKDIKVILEIDGDDEKWEIHDASGKYGNDTLLFHFKEDGNSAFAFLETQEWVGNEEEYKDIVYRGLRLWVALSNVKEPFAEYKEY